MKGFSWYVQRFTPGNTEQFLSPEHEIPNALTKLTYT